MDDYQYKTLNLPSKNKGLFGYGGMPNNVGIGFSGRIIDSSQSFLGTGGGREGPIGFDGEKGATGNDAPLPEVQYAGNLYYDGENWTTVPYFGSDKTLLNFSNNMQYITFPNTPSSSIAVIVYSNGQWTSSVSPVNQTVFGTIDGQFSWFEVERCYCGE